MTTKMWLHTGSEDGDHLETVLETGSLSVRTCYVIDRMQVGAGVRMGGPCVGYSICAHSFIYMYLYSQ